MAEELKVSETGASAWLLQPSEDISVAVGQYEVIHILDQPDYISIPSAPGHCCQVVIWNNRIIPVIDLAVWSGENSGHNKIVAIVIYDGPDGEYSYGGVNLLSIPLLHTVQNAHFCELPVSNKHWKSISVSCFRKPDGEVVPILNLQSIFL